MAKKQTRRSISFSRLDFEIAQEAAQRYKMPLAQLAAEALHEYLERRAPDAPAAKPVEVAKIPPRPASSAPALDPVQIDKLIDNSSVGRGLANIRENGLDAELAELDHELRAADRAGADVQVMYDEDVQARKQAAQRRKR